MIFKYINKNFTGTPKDKNNLTCSKFRAYDPENNLLYEGNTWGAACAKGMQYFRANPTLAVKRFHPDCKQVRLWAMSRKTMEWGEVCQLYATT